MKQLVKTALTRLAPRLTERLRVVRARRHIRRWEEQAGIARVNRAVAARLGGTVRTGPFAGMRLADRATWGGFSSKILGSYEAELAPVMTEILTRRYARVVDVGCAEGYYAVGLAMRLPGRPEVYAFDLDPLARRTCRQVAMANGVSDRVRVRGRCDPAALEQIVGTVSGPDGRSLVFSDCEGYEYDLLWPDAAPGLKRADVLVEFHLPAEKVREVLNRFRATHSVTLLDTQPRDPSMWAEDLEFLPPEDRRVAVDEFRGGPQCWGWLSARPSG